MDDALRVREFWFGKSLTGAVRGHGELASQALTLNRRASLWFESNPQLLGQQDEMIRSQFQELVERAGRGELAGWADSPRRRLSLIILLDQFPRHMFRGTARAFATDEQALAATLSGMQCAADGALDVVERIFFYMPLQHSEVREVQDESVAAYRRLLTEAPQELHGIFAESLQSAEQHHSIIERFGRFPHRNRVLARANTPEEEAWLRTSNDRMGQ